MRKILGIVGLTLVLGAGSVGLRADGAGPENDALALKDGRVIRCQVVEERVDTVVALVHGVRRNFGRALVTNITYGPAAGAQEFAPASAEAPLQSEPKAYGPSPASAANTVPQQQGAGDLVSALSVRYKVPAGDVLWVRRQGVSDADLPLVFLVAATARVTPRKVVALHLAGASWSDIETQFGMEPDEIVYEDGPWVPYPYYYPYDDAYWGAWYGGWGWGRGWGHGGGAGWGRGVGGGRGLVGGGWNHGGGGNGGSSGHGGGGGGRAPLAASSGSSGHHGR